jgi:hypothetical protein
MLGKEAELNVWEEAELNVWERGGIKYLGKRRN